MTYEQAKFRNNQILLKAESHMSGSTRHEEAVYDKFAHIPCDKEYAAVSKKNEVGRMLLSLKSDVESLIWC